MSTEQLLHELAKLSARISELEQSDSGRRQAEEVLNKARSELEMAVELARTNRALRALTECNHAQMRATDESGLMYDICRIIVEAGYPMAWVGIAEHDREKTVRPVAQAGYEKGYLQTIKITWDDTTGFGSGPTGTAIRTGKPSIVRNILTDPEYLPWRAEANKRGYASSIAIPMMVNKEPFGVLNIYAKEADAFDDQELKLLTELADDVVYGINSLRNLGERKHAEDALVQSEEKYSTLMENIQDVIFVIQDEKVQYVNKAFTLASGYSMEEIIGKDFRSIIDPEDVDLVADYYNRRLKGEYVPREYEFRVQRKDGTKITINMKAWLITYRGRVATMGISRDITERKRMEDVLRENEEKYRRYFENISDVVYTLDAQLRVINLSPTVEKILGYKPEELIGKTVRDTGILAPESLNIALSNAMRVLKGESLYLSEYDFIARDGTRKLGEVSSAPLIREGKIIGIISVARDITQKRKMEKALQASEKKYSTLVERGNDGILILQDEKLAFINSKMSEISGFAKEEVIGKPFIDFASSQSKELVIDSYKKRISGGNVPRRYEIEINSKEGRKIPVEINASLIEYEGRPAVMAIIRDMTQHKEAEKKMKSAHAFLQSIIDSVAEPIMVINKNHKVTLMNRAGREFYSHQDPSSLLCHQISHHDEAPCKDFEHFCPLEKVRTKGHAILDVHEHYRQDGVRRFVEILSSPLYSEEGAFEGIVQSFRDITERKEAEEALRRERDLLSRIMETSPAGVKLYNCQGEITFANARAEEVLDLRKDDINQRAYNAPEWSITDYDGSPIPRDELFLAEVMITGKAVYDLPLAVQWPDGRRILLSVSAAPLFNDKGEVEGIVTTNVDVTERIRIQNEVKWRNLELSALATINQLATHSLDLEQLIQNVLPEIRHAVEAEPIMIFLPQDDGMLKMRGFSGQDHYIQDKEPLLAVGECLCGLAFQEGHNIYSEDITTDPRCTYEACKHAGIRSFAAISMRTEEKQIGVLALGNTEHRNFQENDRFLSAIADSLAISIEKSRLYERLKEYAATLEERVEERTVEVQKNQKTLLDLVGELNAKTEELKSANVRLTELDRLKSMFIAATSHELRTPLNSIIGFSSILLEGWSGELNPEQKEQLQYINSAGNQLLVLINDVIDISRIEAGKLDIHTTEFKLMDLVEEVVSAIRQSIEEKGLALYVEIPDIRLMSDRRRLLQCLTNLLSNAVKFTQKGSITLQAKSIKDRINISIIDTGIGIMEDDIGKIFLPFVRLESPHYEKTTGTGLGLYLTKKLVQEVLGGTIKVASEYGNGSSFTLNIPVNLDKKT